MVYETIGSGREVSLSQWYLQSPRALCCYALLFRAIIKASGGYGDYHLHVVGADLDFHPVDDVLTHIFGLLVLAAADVVFS